jgi:UDP-glucose 4-epimerase
MKIAVTGGAGFIGAHLVPALLAQGHQVWTCDNFFMGHKQEKLAWRDRVTLVNTDLLDISRLRDSLQAFQPEIIFHLAAIHYIPYCNEHPTETMRVNVEGTLNVMLAAQGCGSVRGIFFASSAAVYGPTDRVHQEDDATAPSDIYGLSKVLGEQIVTHYARQSGTNYVLGRFFNVYGPAETNPHVIPAVLHQILENHGRVRMGRTDTYRDFIYVDDLVRALVRIGEHLVAGKNVAGTYNLASGQESSVQRIVELMGKAAGLKVEINSEPGRVRAGDRQYLRADISRVRRELGWEPKVMIEQGLEQTVKAALQPVGSGNVKP